MASAKGKPSDRQISRWGVPPHAAVFTMRQGVGVHFQGDETLGDEKLVVLVQKKRCQPSACSRCTPASESKPTRGRFVRPTTKRRCPQSSSHLIIQAIAYSNAHISLVGKALIIKIVRASGSSEKENRHRICYLSKAFLMAAAISEIRDGFFQDGYVAGSKIHNRLIKYTRCKGSPVYRDAP